MAFRFWIDKSYTNLSKPYTGDKCIQILLPDICPKCGTTIAVSTNNPGNARQASFLKDACEHTAHYADLWAMRLPESGPSAIGSMTLRCIRCLEPNPYAEANQPDGTFKCYACRYS